jgi:hypothetical protein
MTTMLSRAVQALSSRPAQVEEPMVDGCAPDCVYETNCVNHRLYRRQCCYLPDCTRTCGDWVDVGAC